MTNLILEFGSNAYPFTKGKLYRMLYETARAGAWGAKVQLFKAEHFPAKEQDAKRELEFPRDRYSWFVMQAHGLGIHAGASVFDEDACKLVSDAGSDFLKLATREQYNTELRLAAQGAYGGTIIRSVEFSRLTDMQKRLPDRMRREIIMACMPYYPASYGRREALQQIMVALRLANSKVPWGWSSHTMHVKDCENAAYAGASVIEKHIDMDMNGPEAGWSVDFKTIAKLVEAIK